MKIRAMNRRVTSGTPASPDFQQRRVVLLANHDLTRNKLILSVTLQAQIVVPLQKHLGID